MDKILIVGLGLIGGSYAKGLTKKGFKVYAYNRSKDAIDYAKKNGIIVDGTNEYTKDFVDQFDRIIFSLYPKIFKEYIKNYGDYIKDGAIISDVTGVKESIVTDIQNILGDRVEFIAAHPMAGKEVYGIENFSKYYLKSIKQMKVFYKIFRYDPVGIKKLFYILIDLICPKSILRKKPLSYKMKSKKKYLNLEHNTWYNPTNKRIRSKESVLELYTKALAKTSNMINEINGFFYYDKKINLEKVVGNLSYVHGLDLSKKKELKHFEF